MSVFCDLRLSLLIDFRARKEICRKWLYYQCWLSLPSVFPFCEYLPFFFFFFFLLPNLLQCAYLHSDSNSWTWPKQEMWSLCCWSCWSVLPIQLGTKSRRTEVPKSDWPIYLCTVTVLSSLVGIFKLSHGTELPYRC